MIAAALMGGRENEVGMTTGVGSSTSGKSCRIRALYTNNTHNQSLSVCVFQVYLKIVLLSSSYEL
jgi:hypothetical protein